jgi:rfaE bifunctional protein kinase chain/domain
LLECFRHRKIPINGILKRKGHSTVTKTRILAGTAHSGRQQVVRIDKEPEGGLDRLTVRELVRAARLYVRASDALLVSDYGYGAATPAILDAIRARSSLNGVLVTLDSRYRMLEFSGANAATPNEPEVEEALGYRIGSDAARLAEAGKTLLQKMKLESLVITRGRDGMVTFARGKKPVAIPIHGSDQIADVTGAGDTVIATFTAALAVGAEPEDAARLANYAGGIVVMKRGTATVTREELVAAIGHGLKPS